MNLGKKTFTVLFILALAVPAFTAARAGGNPAPAPAPGDVLLRSDFSSWDGRWGIDGGKHVVWVTTAGYLALGLEMDPAGWVRQARVDTEHSLQFTYGEFRVRMRFDGLKGAHAAAWSQAVDAYCWSCTEIDLVEHFGAPRIYHTLWTNGPDGLAKAQRAVELDPAAWHVYEVDWTPAGYTFSVDGVTTWQTSYGLSDQTNFLVLSYLIASWERDDLDRTRLGRMRAYVDWAQLTANAYTRNVSS